MAPNRKYQDTEGAIPRNDAYTGLLAISFFAMFIACILLFVDWYSYQGLTPPRTKDFLPAVKAGGAPAAAPRDNVAKPKDEPKAEPKAEPKKDDGKEKMEKKDDAKKDDAKEKKD